MASPQRKSTCVLSVENNLLELRRRAQLESLRYYCALYSCFPPARDPTNASISVEELKKLVRAWKLHERRNFWKLHTTRDELVEALLEYARDNKIDLTLKLEKNPNVPESPKKSSIQESPRRASVMLTPGV